MDKSYILNPPDVIEVPVEYKRDFEDPERAKRALRDIVAYPIIYDTNNGEDLSNINLILGLWKSLCFVTCFDLDAVGLTLDEINEVKKFYRLLIDKVIKLGKM